MKSTMKLVASSIAKVSLTSMVALTMSLSMSLSASAETVYYNGFETMAIGQANDSAVKSAWSTRYAKGPDEGLLEIISDGRSGQAGKVKYPAFKNTTGDSGGHWETNIGYSGEDLYLTYWIKLDADFQCVKGGKLPGFAGAEGFNGEHDWTARLMWREDCKLEWYLHDFGMLSAAGEKAYRVFWDDFGTHAKLIPGQWHHIELRVKLNTPGQLDGKLQGWLDGEMVSDNTDTSGIRAAGNNNVKINQLLFSTFFGGSSAPITQWQPTADVYATFDEFTVSTTRTGVDGNLGEIIDGDDDSDGVLNSIDSCPDTPAGTEVDAIGCIIPVEIIDNDNDGVIDADDNCPNTTTGATVDANGCEVSLTSCSTITDVNWAQKNEITLTGNDSCIRFDRDLSGEALQLWDSDTNSSCDFRGNVSSVDGSGEVTVSSNYASTKTLSGTTFKFIPSNNCKFVKIRAY